VHNFPLLTMLRGERRFPFALLRTRGRVFRPFMCLRCHIVRPSRHVRKGIDHHAKYSKNKKRRVSYSPLLSVPHDGGELVDCANATRESAIRSYLWYKKFRTSTPTCVKWRVIFARQTYVYNIFVLRILWTRMNLVARRLSARGSDNSILLWN